MAVFVGVDVGAAQVKVAWRESGRTLSVGSVEQTPAGHAELVQRIRARAVSRVVLEATGVYYLDLAVALAAAQIPVSVINPRSFHHFAQLKMAATKTDAVDAGLLAEYAERMTPPVWQKMQALCAVMRKLLTGIWACIQRDEAFDSSKLFSEIHLMKS